MEWLDQLVAGLNLSDPAAGRVLLQRLLHLVDWWFVLWLELGFAAVGALIGWAKGAMLRGALLGALLGPVGWVISLLSKSKLPECPACGRGNLAGARRCRHCGADLLHQPSQRSALNADRSRRGW